MKIWFKGISRRWKEYRHVMIVTFIAAAFMSGMLLLQNIMNAYIMEQNYQYYGDWIVASSNAPVDHPYLSEYGRIVTASNELRGADGEVLPAPVLLGYIDQALIDFGRIRLYEGYMPENRTEIAADRKTLERLGYSYDLGQEIILTVVAQQANPEEGIEEVTEQVRYTLTGVMKGFTSVWVSKQPEFVYPGLLVSQEEMSARYQTGQQAYYSRLDPQYRQLDVSEFVKGFSGENILYNSYTYDHQVWGNQKLFRRITGVMILISVAAIVCLLASYTDTRKKSYYRYRCLGMSKRMLAFMIGAECLYATLPAVITGILFSYLAALPACWIAAKRIGGQMFFHPELKTLLLQLGVLSLTILVSTIIVIFRMSDHRIAAGTREYSEKQLKILSRLSEKDKAPVRHFTDRQAAVHPSARVAFILLTILASGLMAAAFWPVTKALNYYLPEYRRTEDFSIGVNDTVELGEYVDSAGMITIFAPNPFLGFSKEEIEELRGTAGISSVNAKINDNGHQILWEGMENSPVLDAAYVLTYGSDAFPEKAMERARKTDPRIKLGSLCHFDYIDQKRLKTITEDIFHTKLTNEELERWDNGDLLVVIIDCHTEDWSTGEVSVLSEDTLKSGDIVEIRTLRQEKLCSREARVILNQLSEEERNDVGRQYDKYQLIQHGYVVMASDRFLQTLEQLEGKERRYNSIGVRFGELASYEATDKVIAEAAASHDAYYGSNVEEKQRILDQEIIQVFGVYGGLFVMTLAIFLILSRFYLGVRLDRGSDGYQKFRQLGITRTGLQRMIFWSELKHCLWVFAGVAPGAVTIWLMNVYQFTAEKQMIESSGSRWGGFYSYILNRDSLNAWLFGFENIFFYDGFQYMLVMLISLFLILLCMTYFSVRREVRRN